MDYFGTMTVTFLERDSFNLTGTQRVESCDQEFTPGEGADVHLRTRQDIYYALYARLKGAHGFEKAHVLHWSVEENDLKIRCAARACTDNARPDSVFCNGHDR